DLLREPHGARAVTSHHQPDRPDARHRLPPPGQPPTMRTVRVPGAAPCATRIRMARQPELFPRPRATAAPSGRAPLAERMRPRTIDEFVGQAHLLGPGRVLRDMVESGQIESLILWGPPGSGKTTLAHLLADASGAHAVSFSAVLQGVKELRGLID